MRRDLPLLIILVVIYLVFSVVSSCMAVDEPSGVSLRPHSSPLGEERPTARLPRIGVELGFGGCTSAACDALDPAEPARPPFVWDYQLGPGLHGPPITRDEARQHLLDASGSEWWTDVMVRVCDCESIGFHPRAISPTDDWGL